MDIKELKRVCKDFQLLYVEDNDELRELKHNIFSEIFSKVFIAKSGYEGLKVYQNEKIDLIITDINMTNMNGIQMLEKIKYINPKQKVLVYSAYSEYEYLDSFKKIGVDAFLQKPLETKKMFETIYSILSKSKEIV